MADQAGGGWRTRTRAFGVFFFELKHSRGGPRCKLLLNEKRSYTYRNSQRLVKLKEKRNCTGSLLHYRLSDGVNPI
jgi:hypothetical protein